MLTWQLCDFQGIRTSITRKLYKFLIGRSCQKERLFGERFQRWVDGHHFCELGAFHYCLTKYYKVYSWYLRSENIVHDKITDCFKMRVREKKMLVQLFKNMLLIVKFCLKLEILLSYWCFCQ